MKPIPTLKWKENYLELLDQRLLPSSEVFIKCRRVNDLAKAIKTLAVRGAPAIGLAASYGTVLAAQEVAESNNFVEECEKLFDVLAATRPTAVNLFYCLNIQRKVLLEASSKKIAIEQLLVKANQLFNDDIEASLLMGRFGADLLPNNCTILTHCNAGGLATSGLGTALSVVYEADTRGILLKVFADETRPLLQGARLTAWELHKSGIDVTVLPDSAAASLLRTGVIDAVITGADRIAMNGDSANKIGTYSLALAAREAGVPFYIVAPTTTIDQNCMDGSGIVIEERSREELAYFGKLQVMPSNVNVYNPAFDVTPINLITSIVCEKGVCHSPKELNL